ncbi:MAG: hybrid sensor histidine kinase/response regulator, partial [Gammaproteobacteria bacterium]|nr:hybrid sensor histidine kinase/response regulator [Gammaproteobacteria bacterium]
IADDEPGMRTGIGRTLENMTVVDEHGEGSYSLNLFFAADGAEATRIIAEQTIDLALLDHGMPAVTGMEILAELRAADSATMVVMVTAYASLEMAVKATKQGAFDFLAKPFTPRELKDVVEKAARHLIVERTARQLAQEKRRVRFEFLSILAHELKAPLGAVESYLRLLDEGIATDDPAAMDRIVGRSLARLEGMRKLIFDLLDLTRIESGEKHRVLAAVDPAAVAARVIETFTPEADRRGITMDLVPAIDVGMQGDNAELEIILNNLVSNAVKYNRDGGQVRIAITGDAENVTISVSDTGIGMSAEDLDSLFGEFVRIKNDKTRLIEGSGLGLSILRRLARINGGEVTVTSVEDEGTSFTVTLSRAGQVQQPVCIGEQS